MAAKQSDLSPWLAPEDGPESLVLEEIDVAELDELELQDQLVVEFVRDLASPGNWTFGTLTGRVRSLQERELGDGEVGVITLVDEAGDPYRVHRDGRVEAVASPDLVGEVETLSVVREVVADGGILDDHEDLVERLGLDEDQPIASREDVGDDRLLEDDDVRVEIHSASAIAESLASRGAATNGGESEG